MVAVDRKGGLSVAYIGDDAAQAEAVFLQESADAGNEVVRLIFDPPVMRTRWPSTEAAQSTVNAATQRVGLATELEAATAAHKTAKAVADKAGADLAEARKQLARATNPASKTAGEHVVTHLAKRADAKAALHNAAAQRVKIATVALAKLDGVEAVGTNESPSTPEGAPAEAGPLTPASEATDPVPTSAPDEAPKKPKKNAGK